MAQSCSVNLGLEGKQRASLLSVSSAPLIPVTGSPSRTNPSNSADDHLEGKELVSLMIKFNQPLEYMDVLQLSRTV